MMASALDVVIEFRSSFPAVWDVASAVAILAALFVAIFSLELLCGADLRRYRTRNFLTDVLYALFYRGLIYNRFFYVPIFAGVALIMPSWHLNLIGQLPPPLQFVVFWLALDAIGYWLHRWQHSNAFLWSFHSVHHSQTCVTFATTFRNHVVDQLIAGFIMYLPLMLLGTPTWYWAPVMTLQLLFEAVQHSDLKWRYGRLYPIIVSPVFHAVHHSSVSAQHDSNYGKILGVWDCLFGTMYTGDRPAAYGVPGIVGRDTFWGTCLAPFRLLMGRAGREPPASRQPDGGGATRPETT
jgi:sterol desaturase/sphingolipid hydroxylase (fatty acid hydroxylase superfamily)